METCKKIWKHASEVFVHYIMMVVLESKLTGGSEDSLVCFRSRQSAQFKKNRARRQTGTRQEKPYHKGLAYTVLLTRGKAIEVSLICTACLYEVWNTGPRPFFCF